MNTKKTIRKILFVDMWIAIGGGMITLLAAAMRQQKSDRCDSYIITIKGATENLFVSEKDVVKILSSQNGGKIKGQPRASFDLMKMEIELEKDVWIKDAELYFDNQDVLHVKVTERVPVARIFTLGGKTWYIDSEEIQMPLSDKKSANVPVFTGFPVKKVVAKKDKELLHEVRLLAEYIMANPFWMAQVAQIDITPERQFEMIPAVGNHIVRFGDGSNIEAKFKRLFVFYKSVLKDAGFDRYSSIDVQFDGQVIGTKGAVSKVDSIQLKKNVEKLLELAREMQVDTVAVR